MSEHFEFKKTPFTNHEEELLAKFAREHAIKESGMVGAYIQEMATIAGCNSSDIKLLVVRDGLKTFYTVIDGGVTADHFKIVELGEAITDILKEIEHAKNVNTLPIYKSAVDHILSRIVHSAENLQNLKGK